MQQVFQKCQKWSPWQRVSEWVWTHRRFFVTFFYEFQFRSSRSCLFYFFLGINIVLPHILSERVVMKPRRLSASGTLLSETLSAPTPGVNMHFGCFNHKRTTLSTNWGQSDPRPHSKLIWDVNGNTLSVICVSGPSQTKFDVAERSSPIHFNVGSLIKRWSMRRLSHQKEQSCPWGNTKILTF